MLWLPAGSICLEATVSGHLIYDLKVPMIMHPKAFIDHYAKSAELADGKSLAEKMKEVCVMLADDLS